LLILISALRKAGQYLWDERDSVGFWPHGEVAPAILGLAATRAGLNGGLEAFENKNESLIIKINMERLHTDFFLELKRHNFVLEDVDDTTLSQLVSVLT
jgi:hypothetical protein